MPFITRPLTGGRLVRIGVALTDRERHMLTELATVYVATTAQLGRLVFGEHKPATMARLGQRHVERLVRFGLMRRHANRSRDRKVGAPGYVVVLTSAGWSLSGAAEADQRPRQRRSWMPSDAFLAHRLAISELYVRLTEHARSGGPAVRQFAAEPDAWRRYSGFAGERLVLKPDAFTRLVTAGQELFWFVEIDRGTEGLRFIADKISSYHSYALSGVEQSHWHGVFPGVLFIVPTAARARAVQHIIDRQPDQDFRSLLFVASEADALPVLATPP